MRYRLRTLLILMAVLPPLILASYLAAEVIAFVTDPHPMGYSPTNTLEHWLWCLAEGALSVGILAAITWLVVKALWKLTLRLWDMASPDPP
jgi:hypothetical protein